MDNIIRNHQSKRQKRNYFTQETEDAIVLYNNTKVAKKRSLIYQRHIHFPFYKLTQNIIHTFKFYYTDDVENLEDLQHEIMVFLLDKIHLFDPSRGAKAYSYFGTIVKRWLIAYNQKNYKKKIDKVSIDDMSAYQNLDTFSPNFMKSSTFENSVQKFVDEGDGFEGDELTSLGYKEGDRLSFFIDNFVLYVTDNIYNYLEKTWYYGSLSRTAWHDRGIRTFPIAAGSSYLFEHENGNDDDGSAMTASVETSQMDIGDGYQFSFIKQLIPDITFNGSNVSAPAATFTLQARNGPGSPYSNTSAGTSTRTATAPVEQFTDLVDVRLRGRSFNMKLESTGQGVMWKLGTPRVDIRPDGRR